MKVTGFEILKRAQGSQAEESRGHPISHVKYNLYFHDCENTTFYIYTSGPDSLVDKASASGAGG